MQEKILRVTALKYGESTLAESRIFPNGAADKKLPISFIIYLIKTEMHMILVDAGCDTMPGYEMKNFYGPVAILHQHGVSAEDITDVIITHAHHDHIEAVHHFKNAVIYIQEGEYAKSGKRYIPNEFQVHSFQDSVEIDGCVKAIKIGGHSMGSCVVEFAMDGEKYVIVGDECYSRVNLEKKIPTASSCCKEKSIEFIQKYSTEEYNVLLCHEL